MGEVHKHVCGHANCTDFKVLLDRNGIWNETVLSYISQIIHNCATCWSTAPSQPGRKVSISSLSTRFSEVMCVDHFYLDEVRLMHFMDLVTHYSVVHALNAANIEDAVTALEAC